MSEQIKQHDAAETSEHVLCHHCDLMVKIVGLHDGRKASCPRCHGKLRVVQKNANKLSAMYALGALFMLLLASCFLFVQIRINGIVVDISLTQIAKTMYQDNYRSLALLFILFVLLIPMLCLAMIALLGLNAPLPKSVKMFLLKGFSSLKHWSMAEIFLAGTLVSFVKLISYGEIGLDESFLPFCLFAVFNIRAFSLFHTENMWNDIAPAPHLEHSLKAGITGKRQGIRLCLCCFAMLPAEQKKCTRCHEKGDVRQSQSITWTLSLVLTSILLYIPANLMSIMTTVALGSSFESNIMAGVIFMWQDGAYPIAMIIFIASVLIPTLKIIALIWLCLYSKSQRFVNRKDCHRMQFVYNMIEIVGRWSMIDIFVVAVISALIRVGILMSVYPDVGAILFALVVVITMIAAMKFDSRLIWDRLTYTSSGKKG